MSSARNNNEVATTDMLNVDVAAIRARLAPLKKVPKSRDAVAAFIGQLYGDIKALRDNKYSWHDIALHVAGEDVAMQKVFTSDRIRVAYMKFESSREKTEIARKQKLAAAPEKRAKVSEPTAKENVSIAKSSVSQARTSATQSELLARQNEKL